MIDNNYNKLKYNKSSKSISDFCVLIDTKNNIIYIAGGLYPIKIHKVLIPFRNEECLRTHINDLIENKKLKII